MGITTTWRGREEQEFGSPWDNLGSRSSYFKRGIQKMPTGALTISQGQHYGN